MRNNSLKNSYRSKRSNDSSRKIWKKALSKIRKKYRQYKEKYDIIIDSIILSRAGSTPLPMLPSSPSPKPPSSPKSYQHGLSSMRSEQYNVSADFRGLDNPEMHSIDDDTAIWGIFDQFVSMKEFFVDEKIGHIQEYVNWYFQHLRYFIGADYGIRELLRNYRKNITMNPDYFHNRLGDVINDLKGKYYINYKNGKIREAHEKWWHYANWLAFMFNNASTKYPVYDSDYGGVMQFPHDLKVFEYHVRGDDIYYNVVAPEHFPKAEMPIPYNPRQTWYEALIEDIGATSHLITDADYQNFGHILAPREPTNLKTLTDYFGMQVERFGTKPPNTFIIEYIDDYRTSHHILEWLRYLFYGPRRSVVLPKGTYIN